MITIDFLYSIIGTPLGYIMWLCYLLVNNFGFAIIIFTLIVKAATFPLNLKQQKNQAKTQLFAPKVKEIQTKYRNNQMKMQEELAKLQQQGYKPMGGCGTMLLTMLLLFGVIDVVYKPMTHMEHLDWDRAGTIDTVVNQALKTKYTAIITASPEDYKAILEFEKDNATIYLVNDNPETTDVNESNQIVLSEPVDFTKIDEAEISSEDFAKLDKLLTAENIETFISKSRLTTDLKNQLSSARGEFASSLYRELAAIKVYTDHPEGFKGIGLGEQTIKKLDNLANNMNFMGINLGLKPSFTFDILILIPILSFALSLAQTFISQYVQKKNNPQMAQMGGGMKLFIYIMPLFSLYISFIVPAGVGFYWAVSYLFTIAQTLITYKIWPPEKLRNMAQAELDAKYGNVNVTATVVDVTTDENGNEVKTVKKLSEMSQKEIREYQRKKIEEARAADRERYGDDDIPDLPPLEEEKTVIDVEPESVESSDDETTNEE